MTNNLSKGFKTSATEELPFGIELGNTCDNPEAMIEKAIKAGATHYEKLKPKPWGQQVGYVQDVNGFMIEICRPLG